MRREEFWTEFFKQDAEQFQHKDCMKDQKYVVDMHMCSSALLGRKEMRLLEVGCGDGNFAKHLIDQGFKEVVVMDVDETRLIRAHENAWQVRPTPGDITEIDGFPQFDTIVFRHSLEHIPDYFMALYNAMELLNEDGLIVIDFYDWSKKKELVPSLIHMFDKERLKAVLEYIGFEVIGDQDSTRHYSIITAWKPKRGKTIKELLESV